MERMRYPACPVFFEEIDENRVMESEFAHSMLLDLRMSYVVMILFSALLSIGLGAIRHVPAPPYRNLFYDYYMIWSPLAQKVLAVAAIALAVIAWCHLKWAKREKLVKERILRSKYFMGKAGSTLLMALPDHFDHGRIESYPESIWLYDEAHLLAYLKKLELDTARFPGPMPVCGECVYRKTDKQQEKIQSIHEIRERAERKTVRGMNQKDMVDKAVPRYGLDALKQTAWKEACFFQFVMGNQKFFQKDGLKHYHMVTEPWPFEF